MKFYTRKLVYPADLNANNTLFGGSLLKWIDEEAAICAMSRLKTKQVVTKYFSEIDFVAPMQKGDVVQIGLHAVAYGRTSITFQCEVRNLFTHEVVVTIEKIVLVHVDSEGNPVPHGVKNTTKLPRENT